jgi:hypothetical protein
MKKQGSRISQKACNFSKMEATYPEMDEMPKKKKIQKFILKIINKLKEDSNKQKNKGNPFLNQTIQSST